MQAKNDEYQRAMENVRKRLEAQQPANRAILDELMDHFATRFDQCFEAGLTTSQAEQMVLVELDSSGELTSELNLISSQQRRRKIMRVTAASTLAMGALVLVGAIFWQPISDQQSGQVIAQSDPLKTQDGDPDPFGTVDGEENGQSAGGEAPGEAEQGADNKAKTPDEFEDEIIDPAVQLKKRIPFSAQEAPLSGLIRGLADELGVTIIIDKRGLEESAIDLETAVTLELDRSMSGTNVLKHLLSPLDLGYYIDDEVIVITSQSELDSRMEVRVYDCSDLISGSKNYLGRKSSGKNAEAALFAAGVVGDGSFPVGGAGPGMSGGYGEGGVDATSGEGSEGGMMGSSGGPGPMMGSGGMMGGSAMGMGGEGGSGMGGGGRGGMGGMMGGMGGFSNDPASQLLSVIQTNCIEDDGTVSTFDGLIVVNATSNRHLQVENLLELLRKKLQARSASK